MGKTLGLMYYKIQKDWPKPLRIRANGGDPKFNHKGQLRKK